MNTQITDFYYKNEGSIILLLPNTSDAQQWADTFIAAEPWQKTNGGIAIESRSFGIIEEAIECDGMLIEEV